MQAVTVSIYGRLFWHWEAVCMRLASSVAEYETLMDRPLVTVARWYIKTALTY